MHEAAQQGNSTSAPSLRATQPTVVSPLPPLHIPAFGAFVLASSAVRSKVALR